MSELFDASNAIMGIRRQLLISACAAALLTSVALQDTAAAESSSPADVPTLWLSVDAQAEQLSADNETFAPAFFTLPHAGPHAGAGLGLQRPPQLGFDLNVEALVQPQNSDWSFKASLKYGRALSEKKLRLTAPLHYYTFGNVNQHPPYYNGDATSRDSHAIVDFKAGRDLGIGLLDTGSQSSINFGVRFAQLQSRSHFHATSGYLHGT